MKTTLIHTHRTQSKKKPNDVTPPPLILGQSRLGECQLPQSKPPKKSIT
ncbi:hypothetical protein ACI1HS_004436 [Vibrio parahaemolyticus]